MNLLRVTWVLLRQNRWLILFLVLWPVGMAALLLIPAGRLDPDDVVSVLHQECFYVIALVSVTAASQLSTEQRARRTTYILSRAVSRTQYVAAIALNALIPGALFTLCFLLCGGMLVEQAGAPFSGVLAMAALQAILYLWFACLAVLLSVFLPAVLASIAISLIAGAIFLLDQHTGLFGLAHLIAEALNLPLNAPAWSPLDYAPAVRVTAQSLLWMALAIGIFNRRDLQLTD